MTASHAAPQHHVSHRKLLADVVSEDIPDGELDAIVVPTARPVESLDDVIYAAKELRVPLVLLCSQESSAVQARAAADRAGVLGHAIDVDRLEEPRVPKFETSTLLEGTEFQRCTDTSLKRNLGVLIASLSGWKRVAFIDDDIALPQPRDLRAAAGLLDTNAVVGLSVDGMPDNSVVCHAYREMGGNQDTFLGGGAMVASEASFQSFFPNIYNEDWFYLLDGTRMRQSTLTGKVKQAEYDPYLHPGRAAEQELGDTLAEGIFGLLDIGKPLSEADLPYWEGFLRDRRKLIGEINGKVAVAPLDQGRRDQMKASLEAAMERSVTITPARCVEYIAAWQADTALWRANLAELHRENGGRPGMDQVFRTLGIKDAPVLV